MKLTRLAEKPGAVRRGLAALAVAGLGATLLFAGPQHATAASTLNAKDIVLGVGSDSTQRTLAYYTAVGTAQQVVYGPTSTFADGSGSTATTLAVTPAANYVPSGSGLTQTYNVHATMTKLQPNTQYSYKVGVTGDWSSTYTFTTGATDFGSGYSADFFGDPQIGASGQTALDGDGWVQTMKFAQQNDAGKVELYLSGGDQIDTSSYTATEGSATAANKLENQWDQFSRPFNRGTLYDGSAADLTGDQIPWAATIGNHDVGTKTYMQHLATPNLDDNGTYYADATSKASTSGGNYWFNYRGVLYIDLNSNSYQPTSGSGGDAAHVSYVRNVVNQHGADAKYTVLMYHHSIYSPADHANDADNAVRRRDFTQVFSDLGVDLVLQGHDHSYTRSYAIKNGGRSSSAKQLTGGAWGAETSTAAGNPNGTTILPGPGGVIYVTANSASGSKYYDLTNPVTTTTNGGDYGPDSTETSAQAQSNLGVVGGHVNHWANAAENQEHVQSYVKINFGADNITVSDVRSGSCATTSANAALQRGNVSWCGDTTNTWGGAVNDSSTGDTDGDGIYAENLTPAAPTSASGNSAYLAAHPLGGLIDLFTIQQTTAPTGLSVSGTPTVGQTLTAATSGGSFTTGTTLTYTWLANGVPFASGSSASVFLTPDVAGKTITASVTGTLFDYDPVTVTSSATAAVAAAPTTPTPTPSTLSVGTPAIHGKARVGATLTATTGTWTAGTALTTVWLVDGKQVQSGGSLALTKAMAGDTVTVEVYGTKPGYTSASATSHAVKVTKAKKAKKSRKAHEHDAKRK
jgi:hypothetical protein